MPYEQGLSDWRVYSAEESVGHDRTLDLEECQALVDEATSSSWWRTWFPDATPIAVAVGGHEYARVGLIASYASPRGYPRPTQWTISLHPQMLTVRILLHELAHCVAPIYVAEELNGRRRGVPDATLRRKHRTHGGCFTAALSVITDNMFAEDGGQLTHAYRHYEAPIDSFDELRAQIAGQPAILDDEEAFHEELRRDQAEIEAAYVAEHGQSGQWVVPETPWGLYFEMMRRRRRSDGRVVSKKAVAEQISKVMPTSVRHITALEQARERPEDSDQLKRAMLMTIFLGADPIWVRYNLLLTRWDCGGITLRQARTVNWRWAKLVSHLNKLGREMPPRWAVQGAR